MKNKDEIKAKPIMNTIKSTQPTQDNFSNEREVDYSNRIIMIKLNPTEEDFNKAEYAVVKIVASSLDFITKEIFDKYAEMVLTKVRELARDPNLTITYIEEKKTTKNETLAAQERILRKKEKIEYWLISCAITGLNSKLGKSRCEDFTFMYKCFDETHY